MALARRALASLVVAAPVLVLTIFVTTLTVCNRIARDRGHVTESSPNISELGDKMPEHLCFSVGFTLLALVVWVMACARAKQLELTLDSISRGSPGLLQMDAMRRNQKYWTRAVPFCIFCLLLMAYCNVSAAGAIHVSAAIGIFFSIAFFQFFHMALSARVYQSQKAACPPLTNALASEGVHMHTEVLERPLAYPSRLILLCMGSCWCVGLFGSLIWSFTGNSTAQYFAASCPFVYFLALEPALVRFGKELWSNSALLTNFWQLVH